MRIKTKRGQHFIAGALVGTLVLCGVSPREVVRAQALPTQSPHYQSARDALAMGNNVKAKLELKLALQEDPGDTQAHLVLANLLAQQGERDQAMVGYQRVLESNPGQPDALYNLGTLLLSQGQPIQAASLLESAVAVRPDHLPSYNNLAKAYYLSGLPDLAVATYKEVLSRDPGNNVALGNLALIVKAAGQQSSPTPKPTPASPLLSPLPSPALFRDTGAPAQKKGDDEGEIQALREILREAPHVTVEPSGERILLRGWTTDPTQRKLLERIIAGQTKIIDLTTDDVGDPQRMIEIDAVIFVVRGLNEQKVGFNFLWAINLSFNYFSSDSLPAGTIYSAPPLTVVPLLSSFPQQGWLFGASVDYLVNIANASDERVAVLARPHLTALNGTTANFIVGGELVYKVSGLNSGDIKPYEFGTTLKVTPTLLRTPSEDGTRRILVGVDAGRTSIVALLDSDPNLPTTFDRVEVASTAVVSLGRTLILSGLSQRESHILHDGVPGLMHIPILKYFFSTKTTIQVDSAVIILLTPRDPAYWGEQYRKAISEFIEKRKAYVQALQGTAADMQRFKQRYPDWDQLAPNRFASHFFLSANSQIYRLAIGKGPYWRGPGLSAIDPRDEEQEEMKFR